MKNYKTKDEIYFELHKEYITPEFEAEIKLSDDPKMLSDYIVKEMLADIDSDTIWLAQFED